MRDRRFKSGAVVAALAAASCSQTELGAPVYEHAQCARVDIIDPLSKAAVRGVEDMALDRRTGRIFFTAYDRRAVEKAARKNQHILPHGGVYAIDQSALFAEPIRAASPSALVAPGEIAGGLRPHGLSYDEKNNELIFINRAYHRDRAGWKMTPQIRRVGTKGEAIVNAREAAPCNANDLLATDDSVLTSFDHGACDWRAGIEDVFRLKRSGVVDENGAQLFSKAAFANGVAKTLGGDIVVAATRENALLFLQEKDGAYIETARIPTPGGPDNLTIAEYGGIVAALHPSLLRLAFNRKLGFGAAPSRLVKVDPETGAMTLLFDDPTGQAFSAATVGIETASGLIVGSVTDKGVLVCQKAA